MNIEENNKLIAEFMGWEIYKNVGREVEYFVKGQLETHHKVVDNWLSFLNMKYHSSWDWLMPVVKHCTDLTRNFEFCSEQYLYWQNELFHPDYMLSEFIENDISSIYSRVVEFIKWYNKQPSNS